MKKIFLLIFLSLLSNFTFSQSESIINLSGEASKKVLPDIAVVNMNIMAKDKSENEALSRMNNLTQEIIERIVKAGFSKDQLKVTGYSIHPEYEYSSGNPKKNGYSANQGIILKFKLDKEKLTALFTKLNQEKLEGFSFYFSSEISKELQKTIKADLIKEALKDAEEKGNLIASSSGLKVKSIKQIDYNVSQYQPPPIYQEAMGMRMMSKDAGPTFANIDIQEIELSESIRLVYLVESSK